ncbi:MAG TPA: hypothetical protein VI750_06885 [Pyrinomonadaceae bacterium]|nr:hypothetical protein [Pyrinomonadaceae bacterium]
MNAKTRTVMTVVSVMLILGLFALEQSTSAQSPISNCKKLKGTSVQVFDPVTGIVSGTVTNAGILDGTLEDVISSDAGFVLTPDPNVVTFLSDLTITTVNGQLKASPLTAFNFVTGFWSEFGNINPNTSTGRFAGATGVIFFSGKTIGNIDTGPFKAQITGEICFANEQ